MVALLHIHKHAIISLCKRYHVKELRVFGSAARESDVTSKSDVDFWVKFEKLPPIEHKNAHFALLFGLEDLLQRDIDLAEAGAIKNPYVLKTVEKDRKLFYAAT